MALALGELGSPTGIGPLVNVLDDATDYWTKRVAIRAMGQIGDRQAIDPLIRTLNERDIYARADAAKALDQLQWKPAQDATAAVYWITKGDWARVSDLGKVAVQPLIEAAQDEHPWVRKNAVEILGQLGHPKTIEALTTAREDEYFRVRHSATMALE